MNSKFQELINNLIAGTFFYTYIIIMYYMFGLDSSYFDRVCVHLVTFLTYLTSIKVLLVLTEKR
jgi:hypothetical protein